MSSFDFKALIGTSNFVNIVFHGLFFSTLDVQTGYFRAYAPKVLDHVFAGGTRQNLSPLAGVYDLSQVGLKGNQPQFPKDANGLPDPTAIPLDIPSSILQFAKQDCGVDAFVAPDSSNLAGLIVLPWPLAFYSLRCDLFKAAFPFVLTSRVGQDVRRFCGATPTSLTGIAMCLRYMYVPPSGGVISNVNIHFFLQPCDPEDLNQVNADLKLAAYVFKNPAQFDLQMDSTASVPTTQRGSNRCFPPPGIGPDDEFSLSEDPTLIIQVCPDAARQGSSNSQSRAKGPDENLNPANCPYFYVGP